MFHSALNLHLTSLLTGILLTSDANFVTSDTHSGILHLYMPGGLRRGNGFPPAKPAKALMKAQLGLRRAFHHTQEDQRHAYACTSVRNRWER
jgi:hypothetical protein